MRKFVSLFIALNLILLFSAPVFAVSLDDFNVENSIFPDISLTAANPDYFLFSDELSYYPDFILRDKPNYVICHTTSYTMKIFSSSDFYVNNGRLCCTGYSYRHQIYSDGTVGTTQTSTSSGSFWLNSDLENPILFANCDIYTDSSLSNVYFAQNVFSDTDTDIDTDTSVSIDFDNTETAIKISKFIDTFSSLLRLLFVFFLMWIMYKFFNIFF